MNSTNSLDSACNDTTNDTEKKSVKKGCCGIYGLKCKITDKWYIGQSVDIHGRWHYAYELMHCKSQPKIYNALVKYGYDGFEKVVVEECSEVGWILDYRETFWIRYYDSIRGGYNLKEGGATGKVSDETKAKISAAVKGRKLTDEQKKKISEATKKACNSPEYKRKISKSWITRRLTGVSDETKAKMRISKLNQSIETRMKISEASKKYKHTEESKNKIREARKEYWMKKKLDKTLV
jgi:group I intron endonuclease